ncbi:MAG: serine/threonine protein kinase [Opitutus sp.]|nr:serine/threonine protein kinase [Opitutus sp.]MCS6247878.1 serine/threonine protein kinase [Opitutus sp.]MCS6275092.1 serine/threonine protein kinase [Opitutus sp.]MCS6276292.1 serine/threonine protein kinase [Opitutus sp.]MCS6301386.1 serine/threonine protein kinase [Opitutus sp.]
MSTDLSNTERVNPASPEGASVAEPVAAGGLPVPKTLWRNLYTIIDALPDKGGAKRFSATRTDSAEELVLCFTPEVKNSPRSAFWKQLQNIDLSHLQRAKEAFVVGAYRVEVCGETDGVALDVWRRERPALEDAVVEALVRQLTEAIGVLQASGLVHLGICPGAIFISEPQGKLHCTLGGLEGVTAFEKTLPIEVISDPFYAPPEAVLLDAHDPGPSLCAWDWWSLGRVVQELILGHPVIDDLPGASATETPAERIARAETLLLEQTKGGLSAGAVEAMPPLNERMNQLLRGLLSSASEVRWGMEAMDSWARQLPVKESYATKRTETKFLWCGRRYSIPDVAKAFQSEANWAEAVINIFDTDTPGALAHFIRNAPDKNGYAAQLRELRQLAEAEPLIALPKALQREVVTSIALLTLGAKNLVWRGKRLDGASLPALLEESPDNPDSYALVRAFTHRTLTTKIDRHDHAAGKSLTQVGRYAEDSEAIIRRNGWLKDAEEGASERIFRISISAESALLAIREGLQKTYACCTQYSLDRSLRSVKPTRVDLVLIAWIEPKAAEQGFVTHADWQAQQLVLLRERSVPLVAKLFWANLDRALEAGPVVFGALPAVLAIWGAATAVMAVLFPGPQWLAAALAPAVIALGGRAILARGTSAELRRFIPDSKPWGWADSDVRCKSAMAALAKGVDRAGLERGLDEVDAEIAKLNLLVSQPQPIPRPPRFTGTRVAARSSWALLAAVVLCSGWRGIVEPPSLPNFEISWMPDAGVQKLDSGRDSAETARTGAVNSPQTSLVQSQAGKPAATKQGAGEKASPPTSGVNAAAANNLGSTGAATKGAVATGVAGSTAVTGEAPAAVARPKVAWPFPLTATVKRLAIQQIVAASPEQSAYALKRGRRVLAPYRPETTQLRVVFEVPVGDQIGVMIFDGAQNDLAATTVFILGKKPPQQTWIEIDALKGFVVAE